MTPRMSRRSFLATLAAAGAVPAMTGAEAGAASEKTLRLVASGSFPPYNMVNAKGELHGVYVDAMHEIFGQLGWRVDYQAYPWARGQSMVKLGEADGFITNPTADRQSFALFATEPLVEVDLGVLIYRRDSPYAHSIEKATRLEDLRPLPTADYYGNAWSQQIWGDWPNVIRTADVAGIIRLLDSDRIAYAVKHEKMFFKRAEQMGLKDRFALRRVDFIPNARNRFHLGLRRSLPGVDVVMAAYEKAQAAYIAAGQLEAGLLKFG